MHQVKTDHQIVAFGTAQMALFDNAGGDPIVTATREGAKWAIHAEGAKDVKAASRSDAVTALIEHALKVLPGEGYSTLVPHGLLDMP